MCIDRMEQPVATIPLQLCWYGIFCRNPSISTTLVGMASSAVVAANVQAVQQALGVDPNSTGSSAAEAAALSEVERILAPVKNITWQSGKAENN